MNRTTKYLRLQKEIKVKADKYASLEIGNSQLGEGYGISEMNRLEMWVQKKGVRAARRFWHLVNKVVEQYHSPVDGMGFSAYEMDRQMMFI